MASGSQSAMWRGELFGEMWVRRGFRVAAILLGAVQAWAARNAINPDGRSHLEIARAYLRHDWPMAINAYWGPLYSWILAGTLGIAKSTLRTEFPLIHAVNFLVFVILIFAFDFFWSELLATSRGAFGDHSSSLPPRVLWVTGYALFLCLNTSLLIPLINADLCIAIVVLLDLAFMLRLNRIPTTRTFILFGLVLGLGYETKAVMFPMGIMLLILSALSFKSFQQRKVLLLSVIVFGGMCAPQIWVLSRATGHLTFSESGKFTFAWSNYNLPTRNWQGQLPSSGKPQHPTRQIYNHPAVFEFNGPIRASYPPWYDPSYWNAGMAPPFQIKPVLHNVFLNARRMLGFLLTPWLWLFGVSILFLLCDPKATAAAILKHWYILAAVFVVSGLYLLTFSEYRYMPSWFIGFWGVTLAGIRTRPGLFLGRVLTFMAMLISVLAIAQLGHGVYGQTHTRRADDATPEYATAEGLKAMGIQTGTKLAAIGFDNDAYFAYLSGLSIVAEINTADACEFWRASPSVQAQVLDKFRAAGAELVVANLGGGVRTTSQTAPIRMLECAKPGVGWLQINASPNRVIFLK